MVINMIEYIFISILLIIYILYFIINAKKYKNKETSNLKKSIKKYQNILYITSVIIFFVILIIELFHLDNYAIKSILQALYKTLSFSIFIFPLETIFLYAKTIKDESKLYIKTIITEENISKKTLKKFNQAGINLIIYNQEDNTLNLPEFQPNEIVLEKIKKNIFVKNMNQEVLKKISNNSFCLKTSANESLNLIYNKIYENRKGLDILTKTIKYNFLTYFPLILTYFFLNLMSFPINYSLALSLFIKLLTTIFSNYLYIKFPEDNDIMTRKPIINNKYISKQEIFLLLLQSMFIFFGSNLIYIYLLTSGANLKVTLSIFLIIIIYSNIFIKYILLTEKNFFYNLSYFIKNKYILIYTLFMILFTIFLNFCNIFNTVNIGIQNYFACIFIAFICSIIYEVTKIARLTSMKGSKKNANKNHKKNRRS